MNGYYKSGMGLGLHNLSDVAQTDLVATGMTTSPWFWAWRIASTVGAGAGAYHGYKRNRGSVGWTIGWFIFGGVLPVFAVPVALAQGYAKPKVARNRRRRTTRRTTRRRRTSR